MDNYEAYLCAALLKCPEFIEMVQVEEKAFTKYRPVYECLVFLKGDTNPGSLVQELQNRNFKEAIKVVSTMVGLYPDPPELEQVEFYAQRLNESYSKKSLLKSLTTLCNDVKDDSVPLSLNLSELGQIAVSAQSGLVDMREPTGAAIVGRALEKAAKGIPPSFSCGFPLIDENLQWRGLKHGHIWVIVGGYKQYKSRTVLEMCNAALTQGKSVSYIGLESDEYSFSSALMGNRFGIPVRFFEEFLANQKTPRDVDVREAHEWLMEQPWRVYDRKQGIGSWKRFSSLIMADKMRYNTDLVVVDHLQKWSKAYDVLGEIDNMLTDVAQQADVAIIVLSQMNTVNIRQGAAEGELPTKGSGDYGALVEAGIEVTKDPSKSDFTAFPLILDQLQQKGMMPYLNRQQLVSEICVNLKIVRAGNPIRSFALFEPYSGKVLMTYQKPFVLD